MLSELAHWVDTEALPRWNSDGFSKSLGLFHERLSFAAQPLQVPYRSMVQARQIYVASHAARMEMDVGLECAQQAMGQLISRYATSSNGETGFAFSIDPASSRVVSPTFDSYTHAFILFATAALYRATGNPGLVQLADEVTRFVERRLFDPQVGGLLDAASSRLADAKRQNPQMHLLEAFLALEEAMPGRGHLERARNLVQLFECKLFDREAGVLPEHFAGDWGRPDSGATISFEPGHHYEWVWLLTQFERISGETLSDPLNAQREQLWRSARSMGHAADDLIVDEVDVTGLVLSSSRRLWPHTEAIKAALAMRRLGVENAGDVATAMARALMDSFLGSPFKGGWIDHVDHDGRPRVDYVPASSLYHLFLARTEIAPNEVDDRSPRT